MRAGLNEACRMPKPRPLKVGSLYELGHHSWKAGRSFACRRGEWTLRIFADSPTKSEVATVQDGGAEFGVFVRQPAIFFLYRFDDRLWYREPTSIRLVPHSEERYPSEPLTSGGRAALRIVLVDATTGKVRALRSVLLSATITKALFDATAEQMRAPLDEGWFPAFEIAVAQTCREYPTCEEMLAATELRCRGDE